MAGYTQGMHVCTIQDQGFRTAKSSGNTVFWFSIIPAGGNYIRKVELTLTEKNIPYVVEKLARLGIEKLDSWGQLDPEEANHVSLVGREVELLNTPEPNEQGVMYDRFDLPPVICRGRVLIAGTARTRCHVVEGVAC